MTGFMGLSAQFGDCKAVYRRLCIPVRIYHEAGNAAGAAPLCGGDTTFFKVSYIIPVKNL